MLAIILIVLGVVCAAYGAAVLALNSGTLFFAVWFVLAALLIGLGIAIRSGFVAALPSAVRIAGSAVLVACAVGIAALSCVSLTCANAQPDDDVDVLIVLGAQVRADGPSTVLRHRLDATIEYYEKHPDVRIVCSGGRGSNEPAFEAQVMRDYLVAHGIPEDAIDVEDRSTTTVENLAFSALYANPQRDKVAVVTNGFHVYRAMAIARKQGYQQVSGLAAYSDPLYMPNNVLREALCIAKDFLTGNI